VLSNYQNLEYSTTTKVLNRCQVWWAQELADINFQIYYRPGILNRKPDALSRCLKDCPEKGGWKNQLITMILYEKQFEDRKTSSLIYSSAQLASFPARKWVEYFAIRLKTKPRKTRSTKDHGSKPLSLVRSSRRTVSGKKF